MLQRNRAPIYGYCSEEFDAVGTGHALVQGELDINFVSEGYLYTALQQALQPVKSKPGPAREKLDHIQHLLRTEQKLNDQAQVAQVRAERQQLMTTLAPDELEEVSQNLRVQLKTDASDPMGRTINPVYLSGPFTIEGEMENDGGHKAAIVGSRACQYQGSLSCRRTQTLARASGSTWRPPSGHLLPEHPTPLARPRAVHRYRIQATRQSQLSRTPDGLYQSEVSIVGLERMKELVSLLGKE